MKLLTLVIVLITCASSYGISCVITPDGRPLETSLTSLTSDNFKKKLGNFSIMHYNGSSLCRVELYINYIPDFLRVSFTEHLKGSKLKDQHIQIDTYVNGNDADDIGVNHYLEYACSDDGCERDFAIKYIDWLLGADYPELQKQLVPLILGEDEGPGE